MSVTVAVAPDAKLAFTVPAEPIAHVQLTTSAEADVQFTAGASTQLIVEVSAE